MTSTPVTVTSLGHSCVLIELPTAGGGVTRLVMDPGNLTPPLDDLGIVDAILITHPHPDHLDAEQVERVRRDSGDLAVYGGAGVDAAAGESVTVVEWAAGSHSIGAVPIEAVQSAHEVIYPGIPLPVNLGFLIGERVYAPGDSFEVPDFDVDILLLPIGGPWMKLQEAIDYLVAVKPTIVIPVHDAGLAAAHRGLHRGVLGKFAPEGTEVVALNAGESRTFE